VSSRTVGRLLIFAGAGVWVVFAVLWLARTDPDAARFVPFHLAGVIPGAILSRWGRREQRSG
jgi:hypothetical protein